MKSLILTINLLFCLSLVFAEGARYLIITHDDFKDAIKPLAEWKHKKGMMAKVVPLSKISPNPTSDTIRGFIKNAYQYWDPRPEYVLLVGDISRCSLGQRSPCESDNYYADMEGDFKAEMGIGRFPCTTATQCSTMVNKVLFYERWPLRSDTLWFKRGTIVIRFDDLGDTLGRYVQDLRFIRDTCLIPDGFTCDSLFYRAGFGWHNQGPDSARHVINVFNEGRGFLIYRGHSSADWYSPFRGIPDSERLQNGAKLPIILAGACNSIFGGRFTVGEKWLRAGTPQNLKGAVAYIGNVILSPNAFWRIYVNRGLFKAICLEDSLTLGHALLKAKESLYVNYPDSEKYYAECNLLGDPELNLWTAVPKGMVVFYDSFIQIGSQDYKITVKDSSNREPLPNALVCVMMPEDPTFYHYGYTDNLGQITFSINPKKTGKMWITVTARNYRPFEGEAEVVLFLSNSPEATYPNQSCHLVHTPNTKILHLTYISGDSVFYSYSSDEGENWSNPEFVDFGKYPAIILNPGRNLTLTPWIAYWKEGDIVCAIRQSATEWHKITIFDANPPYSFAGPPSFAPATLTIIDPMAYVVYPVSFRQTPDGPPTNNYIYFNRFSERNVYPPVILEDAGTEHCFSPGIAVTPGDIIHVSWERGQRIYYRECRNGQWSERVRISYEPGYPTEPASNPSIETYGDYVYCAWRGPNENGEFPGDIWRRARRLTDSVGVWRPPENQSQTPNQESDYPVMSTKFVTVWQESIVGNNWDIWARFESEISSQPIFQTPRPSRFPQINGYWDPTIGMFRCNTIWAEKLSPFLYEVKFGRYDYIPTSSADIPYYSVEVGENNPSPYCLNRDGYLNYGEYSVDYAHNQLKYHLPYLNPRYSYFLRAVVYRRGQNTWVEELKSDTTLLATISSEPNIPETVWIEIPREKYKKDARVLYEIEKEIGNFATIADLRLYQVEIFVENGSGGGQSAGNFLNKRPSLHKPSPNPFRNQTVIRYQLPERGKVFITVYDASGRMVREILNEEKEAGSYTISWDGRDESGNSLPAGVYFYRLKANKFTDTKRAVLIR